MMNYLALASQACVSQSWMNVGTSVSTVRGAMSIKDQEVVERPHEPVTPAEDRVR